ncbi:MAG: cell wall-binding repeat-containing protein [Microbacteriaceae bacterium]|nr:cell wall-binding repeat-containing protein [Microbacteriaceae bacterium]
MANQSVPSIRHAASNRRTIGGFVTSLAVLLTVLVPAASSAATDFVIDERTLVEVEGTLLVLSGQETAADHAEHDSPGLRELTALLPDEIRLVTDDGISIPLSGGLPENVETGDGFRGSLSVPADSIGAISDTIAEAIAGERQQGIVDEDSVVGQEIIEASEALDAPLVVDDATITPETSAAISAVAHTLDVIVVTLPGDPANIIASDVALQTLASRLSGFWNSQTNGQVASFAITGSVRRIVSANACNPQAMWEEGAVLFKTRTETWWMSAGRHMLVIAPEECGRGTGRGTVGSGLSGGLAYAAYYGPVFEQTVGHELGHNLSLRHSNSMRCAEVTACADTEYADYYDVMGGGFVYNGAGNAQLPALNVTQKKRIDGLGGTDLVNVSLPSTATGASTTFTLNPASATSGIRGLEVVDPTTGAVYYVEYRSGTGIDAKSIYSRAVVLGVAPGLRVLRIRDNTTSAALTLVNSTYRNHYLAPGQSFTSLGNGANILFTSNGAAAQVIVKLGIVPKTMNIGTPTISGTPVTGNTLTANAGTWSPTPIAFGYEWLRDGTAVTGASASTYKLTTADVTAKISVRVIGTKSGFTTATATSAATAAVAPPTLLLVSAAPTISGTVKVGYRLTANTGTWSPAPVNLSYQWLRNGTAIVGATSSTFTLTFADVRSKITVKVIGTKSGYPSISRWSASTVAVPLAVQRFGGADRYSSAISMSRTFDPGVDVLYIARGDNYPDALSAAPAAAAAGGPLLLATPTELPTAVKTEIERLRPKKIVVVGGTASINATVYKQLSQLTPDIVRQGGIDRYEASRTIVDEAFGDTGVDRVYLATGRNFPDALSASAAAGANNGAVILVDGYASKLDAATIALIRKLNPNDIVLAGGPASLSTGIENSAAALKLPGGKLRLSGPDRFSTSLALNNNGFTEASTIYIATGFNFPDALAGAPLAGAGNSPLYVVPGDCVPKAMVAAINRYGATKLMVLGGNATVSPAVERLTPCAF